MNADEYQKQAMTFATGGGKTLVYALLGAIEELGELAEKIDFPSLERLDLPFGDVCNSAAYCIKRFVDLSKEAGKTAKYIRKNWDSEISEESKNNLNTYLFAEGIDKELGDICWFVAALAGHIGTSLGKEMEKNIQKLSDRKARGVICGSGDNR